MSSHDDHLGGPTRSDPHVESRRFTGLLRRCLESAGGFTLHHRTGEHACDGVSVCADPEATLSFPFADWDDDRVESWLDTWTGRLRGSDLHLGGWLDPSTQHVWLDVVRVYPASRRRDAVHLGRAHRQKAVFDLGEGQVLAIPNPAIGLVGP